MRLFYLEVKTFTYNKKEKLKSRKQLQEIFTAGKTFTIFPVKVFFQFVNDQDNIIKTGVGVSKKHFKKAVDRNYIKRLLRETYRMEKLPLHSLLSTKNRKLKVFFLYLDNSLPNYNMLQQKIKVIVDELLKETENLNEAVS